MKKTGALIFAAFYLLLTTGMFVCIMHCSGKFLVDLSQQSSLHDHKKHDMAHHKSCGEGRHCCDRHGEYVIKENVKADVWTSLTMPQWITVVHATFLTGLWQTPNQVIQKCQIVDTGPPLNTKTPIYISNNVFRI